MIVKLSEFMGLQIRIKTVKHAFLLASKSKQLPDFETSWETISHIIAEGKKNI